MDVGIERLCWESSTNLFSEHFHKRRAMENPSPNFKHGTFSPASTTPNDSYYPAGDAKTIQLNKILCFILQLRINSPSCFVYLFEIDGSASNVVSHSKNAFRQPDNQRKTLYQRACLYIKTVTIICTASGWEPYNS
ncbi:hypothetical protein CDAR_78971 [Caerostris darwini]|uniref:Uncharacterized protein n=1 Tax=Caerostris darwini TaxID=1538125 RepID=A0AAV4Q547_9ARAC|nr:hypothetical protein CDAR_78971 [Caerostris darwini]